MKKQHIKTDLKDGYILSTAEIQVNIQIAMAYIKCLAFGTGLDKQNF